MKLYEISASKPKKVKKVKKTRGQLVREWNETAGYCPGQMQSIKTLEDLLPHQLEAVMKNVILI